MSKDELMTVLNNPVLSGEYLEKELYEALKEMLEKIQKVYGISGYMQGIVYDAKNNGTKNWFFMANLALEKYEKVNNINHK